jgi:NhaA family Na+:H+ antiporter
VTLMSRSETLTEDDLHAVAERLHLPPVNTNVAQTIGERARRRVQADVDDARASGVRFTPTFFINGRRYDGSWDESSFTDAMLGSLGHRVRTAALTFARWAPSAGFSLHLRQSSRSHWSIRRLAATSVLCGTPSSDSC